MNDDLPDSDKEYHPEAVGALLGMILIVGFALGAVWLCVQVIDVVFAR